MPFIDVNDLDFVKVEVTQFANRLGNEFQEYVSQVIVGSSTEPPPGEVTTLLERMTQLRERMVKAASGGVDLEVTESEAILIRHGILMSRLREARIVESRSAKTFNEALLQRLRGKLSQYEAVMTKEWFRRASAPDRVPKPSDFVPLKYLDERANVLKQSKLVPREYDEKFHILQAPGLFIPDLDEYREAGDLRDIVFGVAFVDIDNFKVFNTEYTETTVDREVLPPLMRCMEAHTYKRGYAYRYGGDEYVILIYNTRERELIAFIEDLRRKIEALRFRVLKTLTVSIGLVCGDGECYFTSREVEAKASSAKAFAKRNGRNCIATYRTAALEESELHIAARREEENSSVHLTEIVSQFHS